MSEYINNSETRIQEFTLYAKQIYMMKRVWFDMGGRFIMIRYFAVRYNGQYKGVVEVSEDITEIRQLVGEKRLLN